MSHADYLTSDQLCHALRLRDLTDPAQGDHAIQTLLASVVGALQPDWGASVRYVRNSPVVPVRENYDRLGYDPGDVTRARRYTRYISPTVMLRSHTSAELPTALEDYAGRSEIDELIVAPGLVYRRDVVDRSHVGEPHQVDLWRIRSTPDTGDEDMLTMIGRLVEAVLPGAEWKTTDVSHPYTMGGRQIGVLHESEWLELAECGRIHPEVLPGSRRDISVVLAEDEDEETLGDRIRIALGDDADVIESLDVLSRTTHEELPEAARSRLGTQNGQ